MEYARLSLLRRPNPAPGRSSFPAVTVPLIAKEDTGKVGDLTADAISCGRTAADQGQSVLDVANELDYLGTAVLSPFSVELAADAEQAAVDVLRAHPPTDS